VVEEGRVILAYKGLGQETRVTTIRFYPVPEALTADVARFRIELAP
jgi:hypothetical protein